MKRRSVDLARRAALRATLFGLHVGAVFAGTECVLIWAAFRWGPAAVVGGLAYAVAGVLALLAYPRTFPRRQRVIVERGLRVYIYSMALILVGALLTRDGTRTVDQRSRAAPQKATLGASATTRTGASTDTIHSTQLQKSRGA